MALVIADRVRETTTTTGTGTITLAGPYAGFQAVSVIGNGNSTYYAIIDATTGAWEVGIGTYTSSGNTLSRDTVLASSNAGSAVSFAVGTKDVIITQPAERAVFAQSNGAGLQAGVAAFTANGVPYANSTSTLTTGSGLTFDGTTLSASNISTAGSTTLSGGTANGVAYLNGSKVLTTGSALTFDGTNFGVGTASEPFSRGYGRWLALSSASSAGIEVNAATGNSATIDLGVNGTRYAYFNATASDSFLSTAAANPLLFGINNAEQMRLTSTGLGIGTSSPSEKLHVQKAAGAYVLTESTTATNSGYRLKNTQRDWYLLNDSNGRFALYDDTAAATRLQVDSSGNLGLGVTPSAWGIGKVLQISAATGSFLYGAGGQTILGTNAYYDTSWKYGGTGNATYYQQANGAHSWHTAPSGTAGNTISFTQAMTLDASGNLGIGTSSPSEKLAINGRMIALATGSGYTANPAGGVFGYYSAGTPTTYVQAPASGQIQFWGPSTAAWATLDSSGNLGIGTSSPSDKLQIQKTVGGAYTGGVIAGGLQINTGYAAGDGSYGHNGITFYGDADNASFIYQIHDSSTDSQLVLGSNNAERIRINGSGNVGIGTSSPSNRFESSYNGPGYWNGTSWTGGLPSAVVITNTTPNGYDPVLIGRMTDSGGTTKNAFAIGAVGTASWTAGSVGTQTSDLYFAVRNTTDGISERMRIAASGNVGIGTSSPSATLHVKGGNTNNLKVDNGGQQYTEVDWLNNGTIKAAAYWDNTNTQFYIGAQAASSSLAFATGGGERARIDSSGNFGLGVTPSAWVGSAKAIQLGQYVSLALDSNGSAVVSSNAYESAAGTWRYSSTLGASRYSSEFGLHKWFTAPSGTAGNAITFTQAMTLNASGRLGVGTTSPQQTLHAYGNVEFGGTSTPFLYSHRNAVISGAVSLGNIEFAGDTATTSLCLSASIRAFADGAWTDSSYPSNLRFLTTSSGSTAPTERARIDSSGNLLVGTTSTGYSNSDSFTLETANGYEVINHSSSRTSGALYVAFGYNGTGIGNITQNGTTAVAYNTSSDYRLKENIQPMTGALAKVAQLKPCTYNWKADGSAGEGFIAHELQAVVPQCVTGEKDAVDAEGKPVYQGIDTSFLVATLTAALQELKAEFDAYKATHP